MDTPFLDKLNAWQHPIVRKQHMIYVQNPELDAESQRNSNTARHDVSLSQMDAAMDFHGIPMLFERGKTFVKPATLWEPEGGKATCGTVLKLCKEWADGYGRKQGASLDMWLCVMPNSYFLTCAGMATETGDTCFIGQTAFLKPEKIGVLHEIGHNLGAEHQTTFCQPNFKEFAAATHKRYNTLMGGGSACPKEKGVENLRLRLFTDPRRPYCEGSNCLILGTAEYDNAGRILKELERDVQLVVPLCPQTDFRGFCVFRYDMTCPSVKVGNFDNKDECAVFLASNPSACPSQLFTYLSRRKKCSCCSENEPLQAEEGVKIFKMTTAAPKVTIFMSQTHTQITSKYALFVALGGVALFCFLMQLKQWRGETKANAGNERSVNQGYFTI